MDKKLMAFWKNDSFPYCLCGEIINMNDNGRVEIKNFGPGLWFKPFLILAFKGGEQIKDKLDELDYDYSAEKRGLKEKYLLKLQKLIKIPQ